MEVYISPGYALHILGSYLRYNITENCHILTINHLFRLNELFLSLCMYHLIDMLLNLCYAILKTLLW